MEIKTFKSNEVLNAALGKVSGDAFRVLYYIIGNLRLHSTTRAEVERVSIAVRLGLWDDESGKQMKKQLDKITKYTDELVDKGFLVKDVIFDSNTGKRKTIYAIPDAFLEQKVYTDMPKLNKNAPKMGVTKQYNKYNNATSITGTTELKDATKVVEEESFREFCESAAEEDGIPAEESIGEYQARMQRNKVKVSPGFSSDTLPF